MSHSNVYYFATILFVLIAFRLQFEIIKADDDKDSAESTSHLMHSALEQDKNQSGQARITSSEEDDDEKSQESIQKQQLLRRSESNPVSVESISVSKTCKYQRLLPNGQIEFDSTQAVANHSDSIELIENSRIKFECLAGYHLKVTKANSWSTFLDKNYVIEKCNRLGNIPPNSFKKFKQTRSKSSNFYECIKSCKLNRHSAKLNGILVPFRKLYVENDRITLLCNEGHVASLQYFNQTTIKTNNLFSFECHANGAWYLFPERVQIDQLPTCESLNIPSEIFDGQKDIEFNLNYENLRTISVMFFVCILLLTLFILIVFTIKLRKKLFNNIEQQLSNSEELVNEDGFIRILNTTANTDASNETTRRSIYPTALSTNRLINFDSQLTLGAYSRIIDATLPTYEEATNSRGSNMVTSANNPNALNTQTSNNNK